MQSERTSALITRLKAHLEKVSMSQVMLSKKLGISAANLSEIMRGNNSPNAEVTLHITEFLKEQTMATELPKTLASARDRISELEAQLAGRPGGSSETAGLQARIAKLEGELKTRSTELVLWKARAGGNAPSQPGAGAPSQPSAPQPSPFAAAAPTDDRNIGLRFNSPPPLAELSPVDQLRAQLGTEKDPMKRGVIYQKLKALEAELSGPQPVARMHAI